MALAVPRRRAAPVEPRQVEERGQWGRPETFKRRRHSNRRRVAGRRAWPGPQPGARSRTPAGPGPGRAGGGPRRSRRGHARCGRTAQPDRPGRQQRRGAGDLDPAARHPPGLVHGASPGAAGAHRHRRAARAARPGRARRRLEREQLGGRRVTAQQNPRAGPMRSAWWWWLAPVHLSGANEGRDWSCVGPRDAARPRAALAWPGRRRRARRREGRCAARDRQPRADEDDEEEDAGDDDPRDGDVEDGAAARGPPREPRARGRAA